MSGDEKTFKNSDYSVFFKKIVFKKGEIYIYIHLYRRIYKYTDNIN